MLQTRYTNQILVILVWKLYKDVYFFFFRSYYHCIRGKLASTEQRKLHLFNIIPKLQTKGCRFAKVNRTKFVEPAGGNKYSIASAPRFEIELITLVHRGSFGVWLRSDLVKGQRLTTAFRWRQSGWDSRLANTTRRKQLPATLPSVTSWTIHPSKIPWSGERRVSRPLPWGSHHPKCYRIRPALDSTVPCPRPVQLRDPAPAPSEKTLKATYFTASLLAKVTKWATRVWIPARLRAVTPPTIWCPPTDKAWYSRLRQETRIHNVSSRFFSNFVMEPEGMIEHQIYLSNSEILSCLKIGNWTDWAEV